jgi:sn-glycerol 3-phosphate transport system permease protein
VVGTARKRWLVLGVLIALPSSQILTLTTQHCTYDPTVSFASQAVGVGLTAVGALIGLLPFWTYLKRGASSAFSAGYFRSAALPYLLLLPMVINLLIFLYYPSLQTVILSLFSRRFPLPQERFVCLDNYVRLFEDAVYQNSFFTTLILTVFITFISMGLSLAIALLVSQKIRFALVYRTLLIWPFALSPVVAGAIFLTMFREGQTGLINAAVYAVTGTTLSWLRDPDLARVAVVAASVWNILGFNILFYVAGLQNIPADVLEAAQIDGANRVQRFWRVTFPLLAPFSFFLLVTNVTYSFYGIYGAIDTLTRGGPPIGAAGELGGATNVLIYKLYQDAFTPGSPAGLAAAQAVILFLLVAGLTVLQFRTIESRITYGE